MKKIYLLIIVSALFFTSCSQKEPNDTKTNNTSPKTSDIKIKDVSELEKSKIFTPVEIKYDNNNKKLNIWTIVISEGFPESIEWFVAPVGEKTYINSNVKEYYFFATKKSKQEILSYYRNIATKLGYKEVKENKPNDDSRISFKIAKDNTMPSMEKIIISTNTSIPENLEALKLSGLYVEVRKE